MKTALKRQRKSQSKSTMTEGLGPRAGAEVSHGRGLALEALETTKQSEKGAGSLGFGVGLPFLDDLSSQGKGQRHHSDVPI